MYRLTSKFSTALLASIVLFSSHLDAVTFTVNSTVDATDLVPGDGSCETTQIGECTLRAAIQETNALDGIDAIDLPSGTYVLTISGSGEQAGDLNITDDLKITGTSIDATVIDGGGIDRVLSIGTFPMPAPPPPPAILTEAESNQSGSNIVVSLSNLSITNGRPGLKNGGGIVSQYAEVILNNVSISNNISGVDGGGIYNFYTSAMTIVNSTLMNNEAKGSIGGGAIRNMGKLYVFESTITNNKATSVIGGPGGGISTGQSGASLLVVNSTISANTASGGGGGIFSSNHSTVTVIKSSTITGNVAAYVAGAFSNNYDLDIDNTLISGNLPTNCVESPGTITSLGNNLDSDGTCDLNAPNDLKNVNPLIGPLQDNGGPTETHALLDGSPAIDAGGANCTDASGQPLLADQRGEPRPVDGNGDGQVACDIGAYETQLAISTITIDIKPDSQINNVNPRSKGVIAVAILTSEDLDALQVDVDTVQFGPAGTAKAHSQAHVKDVDYDGDMDLLFHFRTQETGIQCGDIEAALTGQTWDGTTVSGTDSVNPAGCR